MEKMMRISRGKTHMVEPAELSWMFDVAVGGLALLGLGATLMLRWWANDDGDRAAMGHRMAWGVFIIALLLFTAACGSVGVAEMHDTGTGAPWATAVRSVALVLAFMVMVVAFLGPHVGESDDGRKVVDGNPMGTDTFMDVASGLALGFALLMGLGVGAAFDHAPANDPTDIMAKTTTASLGAGWAAAFLLLWSCGMTVYRRNTWAHHEHFRFSPAGALAIPVLLIGGLLGFGTAGVQMTDDGTPRVHALVGAGLMVLAAGGSELLSRWSKDNDIAWAGTKTFVLLLIGIAGAAVATIDYQDAKDDAFDDTSVNTFVDEEGSAGVDVRESGSP